MMRCATRVTAANFRGLYLKRNNSNCTRLCGRTASCFVILDEDKIQHICNENFNEWENMQNLYSLRILTSRFYQEEHWFKRSHFSIKKDIEGIGITHLDDKDIVYVTDWLSTDAYKARNNDLKHFKTTLKRRNRILGTAFQPSLTPLLRAIKWC
jgi:hypothetical protein